MSAIVRQAGANEPCTKMKMPYSPMFLWRGSCAIARERRWFGIRVGTILLFCRIAP